MANEISTWLDDDGVDRCLTVTLEVPEHQDADVIDRHELSWFPLIARDSGVAPRDDDEFAFTIAIIDTAGCAEVTQNHYITVEDAKVLVEFINTQLLDEGRA